jgi:hypothetical protein
MLSSVTISPAKRSAMDFMISRSGDSLVSSHFQDVNTFSDKFPDLELCQTIEKTKSLSSARSRRAIASASEKGSSPL